MNLLLARISVISIIKSDNEERNEDSYALDGAINAALIAVLGLIIKPNYNRDN